MLQHISAVEILVYTSAWVSAVFYSMYKFYNTTNRYTQYITKDLAEGWSWVGRRVDTSDYEWNVWSPILLEWLCYVLPFIVFSLLLKRRFPNVVAITCIALSLYWLCTLLGLPLTLFIFTQPIIFLAIARLSSMIFVWIVCLTFTLGLHMSIFSELKAKIFKEDSHSEYFFAVLLAWTQARSISYLTDTQKLPTVTKSWKNLYYYCFYLPVLPSGPLLLYREFDASLKKVERNHHLEWKLLFGSFVKLTRYLFWWAFNHFALHFFYHTALQYHPNIVRRLDIWSAAGLGYTLGQFFMLKYIVLYGVPSSLANLDEIEAPPAPKCVGRIHLYSQMWRDFDRGLYNFMFSYIYIPLKGTSDGIARKLCASALCFGFVCIWHGAFPAVIIWCVSNYLGICMEALGKHLSTLEPIATWKGKWRPANWIRFQALAASPLLLMSALSNFCFFTDATVGFFLARKVFEGGLQRVLLIIGAMYCCCHVSMALSRREQLKKNAKQVMRSLDD